MVCNIDSKLRMGRGLWVGGLGGQKDFLEEVGLKLGSKERIHVLP